MNRREELKILIASLVDDISKLYEELRYSGIEVYISKHGKIQQLQLQIDNYIKELKELNK